MWVFPRIARCRHLQYYLSVSGPPRDFDRRRRVAGFVPFNYRLSTYKLVNKYVSVPACHKSLTVLFTVTCWCMELTYIHARRVGRAE